ncbi:MAG: ATP-binding cassette domain-containing protein [Saprospiraceae bacterium]|nr:ATP-binding cassette domain-containing protein [Bacteroidia bacterium]NNE14087.1 ATP-binding cassette domain-containing protein [Saprospiraceae bacterium]NNL92285.1 ATP-binding cassette domain-containing protein [Saprospiraceae bacterium]
MEIILDNIGKRYASGWIFRDLSMNINSGDRVAIRGLNGSGKSTLLKILCGYLSPSMGTLEYHLNSELISRDDIYKNIGIIAAYTEMDEELNPLELFNHYKKFKPYLIENETDFLKIADLEKEKNKAIKDFSSGMKQRLNIALGVLLDLPLLLLDEPSSFLDKGRKKWLGDIINEFTASKTVITASNEEDDLINCNRDINL